MAQVSTAIVLDSVRRVSEQPVFEFPAAQHAVQASILIKSNDQCEYLQRTFPKLAEQTENRFEVILIYSGTNDATVELAEKWGASVIRIEPRQFSHPRALNLGAESARGEFIVCLSADAVPVSECWLHQLLKPFRDETVAAVYGRHLPNHGANLLDYQRSMLWYGPRSRELSYRDGHGLSNANSAIRRSLWQKHQFVESLPEVEDYEWGLWAQENGYKLYYSAEAAVYHSHGKRYGFWRYLQRISRYRAIRHAIDSARAFPVRTMRPYLQAVALSSIILAMLWILKAASIISQPFFILLTCGPLAMDLVSVVCASDLFMTK